jgi:plasmid stabilization system protein ParE
MRLVFFDRALDDLEEICSYYEAQQQGLGSRFRFQVQRVIEGIASFPKLSIRLRNSFRLSILRVFRRYGVIYRIHRKVIVIHGIVPLQRGKAFWKYRLH